MNAEFIEALMFWNENGSSNSVDLWLQQQGLTTMPMTAGILISGTRSQFEMVFAVDLKQSEPPLELPVPTEIAAHVATIEIPSYRQPY
jgi:hypothetical protein